MKLIELASNQPTVLKGRSTVAIQEEENIELLVIAIVVGQRLLYFMPKATRGFAD